MLESASIPAEKLMPSTLSVVPSPLSLREQIDSKRRYLACKRIFDVCFSLIFSIVVLSWLLPLLFIIIRLGSKGPVLFLQKRVGFGGKSFTCYKLRTMYINDECDALQATDDDKRITPIGRFLRKTNMDEFPQFFNVLKGDMSVVGPRPHMYADCKYFSCVQPGYKLRTFVKPGLTGLAQIKGYHGPSATTNSILLRFYWEKYYIRHISPQLDIKIILITILQRLQALFFFLPEPATTPDLPAKEMRPS